MKDVIKASIRNSFGTSEAKHLRREGNIPAVVYGHHSATKNISLCEKDMDKILRYRGVGATFSLDIEGEEVAVMIKDVQTEVLRSNVIHIDLQELTKGVTVKVSIPIYFHNKEAVESSTTLVVEQLHEMDIEVLPENLIEFYDVDVSCLKEKGSILLSDLEIFSDDRFTIFNDPDTTVASLTQGGSKEPEETDGTDEMPVVGLVGESNKEE